MTNKVTEQVKPTKRSAKGHTTADSLMRYAEFLGYGEIHIKIDEATGLKAIIAIHSLARGPAIGGARLTHYHAFDKAMEDAIRLGYMMSYKAAITNLPHGGGKAVLIKPKEIKDIDAYFEKFGDFINELGGRYITAVNSGTSPKEMDIIARRTPYVTCTTKGEGGSDPSPLTALGVRRAIEAAVRFKFRKDDLNGIRINIQGAGHVGYALAKELVSLGADITMTDTNQDLLHNVAEELGIKTCQPETIYALEGDVFSPCALGAILNHDTINQLNVKIVAGSANNQLAHHQYGKILHERGILYAPDFLINSGGLIHVAVIYDHGDLNKSVDKIKNIYYMVYDIFERAAREDCATNIIAERIARERLACETPEVQSGKVYKP